MRSTKYIVISCLMMYVGVLVWALYAYGLTASTVLTVASPSPTPTPGTFLQFGNGAQTLTTYTSGTSLWLRSFFGGDPLTNAITAAEATQVGMSSWNLGLFQNPVDIGCSSTNFSLGTPGNGVVSPACTNWHNYWVNNLWNPYHTMSVNTGFPIFSRTDGLSLSGPEFFASSGWANSAVHDYSTQLFALGTGNPGTISGQFSPDEVSDSDTSNPSTNSNWVAIFGALGLGSGGFPHVPWGVDPNFSQQTGIHFWWDNPNVSDYGWFETGQGTSSTAGLLSDALSMDIARTNVITARGNILSALVLNCNGPFYQKTVNNTSYTPGSDVLFNMGNTPGGVVATQWFAVAHGYAGEETYFYDGVHASERSGCVYNGTTCLNQPQTGCSPVADAQVNGGYGGIGQDRWYALGAAWNVMKALDPYILQPAMTAPPSPCNPSGNACTGTPIITGAKQGNGGRLVVLINFSDSTNNYSYDPTNYSFGTGTTAQSYKIIGADSRGSQACTGSGCASTNALCGAQATLPSVNDCGVGFTSINGVNWLPTSTTLPAAGVAPTTVTNLSMQPLEVDVFLYHP